MHILRAKLPGGGGALGGGGGGPREKRCTQRVASQATDLSHFSVRCVNGKKVFIQHYLEFDLHNNSSNFYRLASWACYTGRIWLSPRAVVSVTKVKIVTSANKNVMHQQEQQENDGWFRPWCIRYTARWAFLTLTK
ncbi:hypothetical protein XU18_1048 [Perkinsela sp. CCAP 1560/4]|nr:hypothetical protein XU18_1048 [Perkinsela sp. CCAP 1560/4]|eukprot:KNH08479.1 hypothetical protein XU18_1048 [Perkinsela sp. CCAP 1560/4]